MAYLTFQTPEGEYCTGDFECMAYRPHNMYCEYFHTFLPNEYPAKKCPECMALGKYGTCKEPQ